MASDRSMHSTQIAYNYNSKYFLERPTTLQTTPVEHRAQILMHSISLCTVGHFTFLISLSLRPKTETKRPKFSFSPEFGLSNHRFAHHCSLHNVITDVIADISVFLCLFLKYQKNEVIFVHRNLISNRLTCKISR